MTAPEQPTAESRPARVSDERVASIIDLLGFRPDLFTERQKLAIEARDSRAREAKQAEEIARLTAALAEAEAERDCLVEQVATLRESALYEELQQVMKAHNATLVALAEAQAQAAQARNAALEAERQRVNDLAISRGCNMRGRNLPDCAWPHCPCPIPYDPRKTEPRS